MKLEILIQIAGLLHLVLLVAGVQMPRVVGFNEHISVLPTFLRRLFRVYYAFIGGIVMAFGVISYFLAEQLVAGGPTAGALLILMVLFWIARFGVALFVFDMAPYLTSPGRRLGYHFINILFALLPALYAYTYWKGINP